MLPSTSNTKRTSKAKRKSGRVIPARAAAIAATLCMVATWPSPGAAAPLVWPDAKPVFPIEIDASGQGFVDQRGVPFLMVGDSPWSLMVQLTDEQLAIYFANRRAQGFNTLLVEVAEAGAFGGPANTDGNEPFEPLGDFERPVEAYWKRVDQIIDTAADYGFLLILTPMYVGYNCNDEGWGPQMQSNSIADHESFARFLANRYSDRSHILWLHGGDVDASTCGLANKVNALALELKKNDPGSLHSGHCNRGRSSLDCYDEPWLDTNGVYSDCQSTAERTRNAVQTNTSMPHYYIEGYYENENNSTNTCLMSQMYWPILGGLQGSIYGNRPVWLFDDGWNSALHDPGATLVKLSAQLLKSRPWADLVPDYAHEHVTSGYGPIDSPSYVATAVTTDKRTLISYAPEDTTLSVDLTTLSGSSLVAWNYDPTTGESTHLGDFEPIETIDFVMDGPAVLVIDDAAAGLNAPGTSIYYVPEPGDLAMSFAGLTTVGLLALMRRRRELAHRVQNALPLRGGVARQERAGSL